MTKRDFPLFTRRINRGFFPSRRPALFTLDYVYAFLYFYEYRLEVAMPHTLSIMEARKQLTSLPETLFHNGQLDVLEITRRGKPVLAVLPWELYEAVSETLEVLGDKELMAQLRQSISEMDSGKLISWQDAKQELGL